MAGGAQFAAIGLWNTTSPLLPIALTVLAINSRHLIFGASLARWLKRFPPSWRYLAVGFISDPTWAATNDVVRDGEDDLGFLLGCGAGVWTSWVAGTGLGQLAGDALGERFVDYGLDTVLATTSPHSSFPSGTQVSRSCHVPRQPSSPSGDNAPCPKDGT